MNKMQNLLSKINRKSKKTIAAVTVAAAVLFAALTGVTALTVYHFDTEPAQTTLSVAEEVTAAAKTDEVSATAANALNTAPAVTTTPAQPTSANNFASSNKSTGSKNTDTGKTGSSANSGGASHSSGTSSKPSSGSNNSSAKPSGGSTSKPETTTSKPETTQPEKQDFPMTEDEIIAYASKYIEDTYHCTYYDGFGKNVPGTGYNTPSTYTKGSWTEEQIKADLRGSADSTYIQNGWYKVYVERVNENTIRVYMFY